MNVREILESLCGPDIYGKTKASVGIWFELRNVNNLEEVKPIEEIGFIKPIVSISRRAGYVQVDFIYEQHFDADLREQWRVLEKSLKPEYSYNEETGYCPVIVVQLTGKDNNDFVVMGTNPILWSLTPSEPGKEPNVLRVVFEETSVDFFRSTD